ncbi:MAG TPA: ATPase, T2SS/T4P/T4SS family [Pseudomonadales bacterium]
MKQPCARVKQALADVPRQHFITSTDMDGLVSGHSIPRSETVSHLLGLLPQAIDAGQTIMHVGGGSGYLAAVLARLAGRVIYVERNAQVADKARQRFDALAITNIDVVVADAAAPLPALPACQLVICTTFLPGLQALLPVVCQAGHIACLEDGGGAVSRLALFVRQQQRLKRVSTLGWIDFSRKAEHILIDLGMIDEQQLRQARVEAAASHRRLLDVLRQQQQLEEKDMYRALARQQGLQFVAADEILPGLQPALFRRFSRTFLDQSRMIPVTADAGMLTVITDDPDVSREQLQQLATHQPVTCQLVTPTDFRRIWSALDLTAVKPAAERHAGAGQDSDDSDDLLAGDKGREISPYLVSVYEAMLLDAISEKASDIHIEQYNGKARIRLRVDGDLHDLANYPLSARELRGVINVIKLRAELNIAERRLPQGGRTRLKLGGNGYDLRVQTQPSLHGEHVVIRLLPQTGRAMTVAELGMAPVIAARYQRLLANPAGLVLVVGPTGSGKSTTLYAGLQTLADDARRKVITVEDPIEYSIDNVQQTRVRNDIGFGFADAMRAFVREDPDVIMVGEIRDQETALEAIRASQTGHVVLSTLHCNDAVDALQRLYDLGIHPNSIAGELMAVIAQRLAKRICEFCRRPATADAAILAELFPHGAPDDFRCFVGAGCEKCNQRGTRGRVAVVEFMEVNSDIRNSISSRPPIGELRWQALDAGLVTMRDSALDHVIQGVIPLTELPRILPRERMAPEIRGGRRGSV